MGGFFALCYSLNRVQMKQRVLDELFPRHKKGEQWYFQQAGRAVNQAIGRVIRHISDYGLVVLVDQRFEWPKQLTQLSKWIQPSATLQRQRQVLRWVKKKQTNNDDCNFCLIAIQAKVTNQKSVFLPMFSYNKRVSYFCCYLRIRLKSYRAFQFESHPQSSLLRWCGNFFNRSYQDITDDINKFFIKHFKPLSSTPTQTTTKTTSKELQGLQKIESSLSQKYSSNPATNVAPLDSTVSRLPSQSRRSSEDRAGEHELFYVL